MFNYIDIYNMTSRFLERIKATNRNTNDYKDDLYAFFIFCYHLSDYLEKDTHISNKHIYEYIDRNPCLTICRNICNLTKHKEDRGADYGLGHIKIGFNECLSVTSIKVHGDIIRENDGFEEPKIQVLEAAALSSEYGHSRKGESANASYIDQSYDIVDSLGCVYDAFDTAQKCYDLWTVFLVENGLLK